MILLNDFFFIQHQENSPNSIRAIISINPHHKIFEGHFPEKPVVPGVCLVQIILELIEKSIQKKTRLTTADAIKFLSVMTPKENELIEVTIQYSTVGNDLLVNASIFSGPLIFFKLKATLAPV